MTSVEYALGKSDEVAHQWGSSRLVPFVLRVVCSLSLQGRLSIILYRLLITLYRLSIILYRWFSRPFARAEKSVRASNMPWKNVGTRRPLTGDSSIGASPF